MGHPSSWLKSSAGVRAGPGRSFGGVGRGSRKAGERKLFFSLAWGCGRRGARQGGERGLVPGADPGTRGVRLVPFGCLSLPALRVARRFVRNPGAPPRDRENGDVLVTCGLFGTAQTGRAQEVRNVERNFRAGARDVVRDRTAEGRPATSLLKKRQRLVPAPNLVAPSKEKVQAPAGVGATTAARGRSYQTSWKQLIASRAWKAHSSKGAISTSAASGGAGGA